MVSANESNPPAGSGGEVQRRDLQHFYKRRHRVSLALLLFVVVAGLPIVGVPYLRNRLSERILTLKAAMAGDIRPVFAQAGANAEPFPAEYEKPTILVPQLPQLPPVESAMAVAPEKSAQPRGAMRRAPMTMEIKVASGVSAQGEEPADQAQTSASAQSEPKYQQGKPEQDAYDLLLKSNSTVAGMVRGSNPSLHFKSWDVANRGEDLYWVRLRFQSEGNPDVEYIWQVKLQAGQVTPLSYNARALP